LENFEKSSTAVPPRQIPGYTYDWLIDWHSIN